MKKIKGLVLTMVVCTLMVTSINYFGGIISSINDEVVAGMEFGVNYDPDPFRH